MVSHVYFDFFGTLVVYDPSVHPTGYNAPHEFSRRAHLTIHPDETDALWQRAWDELETPAHASGVEFSMHDVVMSFWQSLGSPAVNDRAFDVLIEEYLDAWSRDIRASPGAALCLDDLAADHHLSVVSNTHHADLVHSQLRRFGLDTHISDVFTSVEIGWRKPRPEIFHAALSHHGITSNRAAFVGDNWVADIEGPQNLGMRAVYVGRPTRERPTVPLHDLPRQIRALP